MEGEVVRIFVGGLDGSVSSSDVEKRFSSSSLGIVKGVELISKNIPNKDGDGRGRSFNFAYIDFLPSSPTALSKLFSIYNGCIWKGGRLKLDKAKEHYLLRLKREWAQDSQLLSAAPKNLPLHSNTGHDKTHLNIFFPKLYKVKSLPFSGTGKHKYSFQRVEVPSLPTHFCDCNEHCTPSEAAAGKRLSTPNTHFDGVNDEELDVMTSVMKKLFEREANVTAADSMIASNGIGNYSSCLVDAVPSDEMEAAQSTEEDNLVTNIVMESGSMQIHGSKDQDLKYSKLPPNDGPPRKQTKAQKRKNTGSTNHSESMLNKKARLLAANENDREESSIKFVKRRSSEVHSRELESSAEAQPVDTQLKSDDNRSAKGLSWVQKSSWKELVGEAGNSLFSITHVLPGITSMKQRLPKSNDLAAVNSISSKAPKSVKHATIQSNGDSSKCLEVRKQGILKDKVIAPHDTNVEVSEKEEKIQDAMESERSICKESAQVTNDNFFHLSKESKKKVVDERKTTIEATPLGEVCTFMRSADSEREWTKARAALSGFLKKKTNENNTSKISKSEPNRNF
ncbi:protein REPRESSOR OF SILENCING 3 [Magnolia sinica]|uniref:protein REPRESSOR OF SILENCING 3 n=1 Tax=Magnolia sinica TaxID=86752 RepID=UPI0026583173|nr:protein REPRESSOR OF SILENCING 3 [Magnolia sinica]